MVRISDFMIRESKDGKSFVALELQGELEMVQSSETNKFYATARRCSITSTFDEETAKTLIGKTFPGRIVRVQSDPYEYTIKETGEVIKLAHSYQYLPEETPVVQREPVNEPVFI
jgi:hypothetical protein